MGNTHKFAFIIFSLALLYFGSLIIVAPDWLRDKPCSDCDGWYFPVAENLISGKGLVVGNNQRPALDRPPGHVFILAAALGIGNTLGLTKEVTVYCLNTILLSCAAVLLFLISKQFWGIGRGAITSLFWVTSPFVVWFINQPFSEVTFFIFFYSAVLGLFWSIQSSCNRLLWVFCVGICLGVASLIRPMGIGLVILFMGIYGVFLENVQNKFENWLSPLVVAIGFTLIFGPWQMYLWEKKGEILFISDGQHAHASVVEGFVFGVHKEDYRISIDLSPDVQMFMESMDKIIFSYQEVLNGDVKYGPGGDYDVRKLSSIPRIAANILKTRPVVAIKFVWLKIKRSWYGTDSHRYEKYAALLQIVYLLIIVPALIKVLRDKENRFIAIIAIAITGYFWLFCVMFTPLVRYMIPAIGVLFTLIPGLWLGRRSEKTGS